MKNLLISNASPVDQHSYIPWALEQSKYKNIWKKAFLIRKLYALMEKAQKINPVLCTPDDWFRIEELGKLNYALDVQLQKEREDRKHMQASLRGGSMPTTTTTTIAQQLHSTSSSSRSSPRVVVDNRESTSPE